MAKRRKQTLPALLIGPVALLAVRLFPAFGPMLVGGLPQPRRRMGVMERLGRDRLVAGAMLLFLTLVMYTAPGTEEAQAAAAIQYRGFIGSATGAACSAPSTTAVAADEDSHVKQSTPTANAGSASVLSVRSAPGDNDRAYIHFPLPAIPADCALSAATLRLTTTSALNNRWYDVYRATGAWTESGVTWDNQPGGTGIPATARTGPGTIEWEVTSHVRNMYSGTNTGFMLRDSVEDGSGSSNQYSSREGSNPPSLTLTWGSTGGTSTTLNVPASGVAAGNSVILAYAMDDWTAGPISATDSKGNTYSLDADATYAGSARQAILSAHDVKALGAGDTITVTHPFVGARAFTANQFSGLAPTGAKDVTAVASGNSMAPSSGAAATTQADELLFGAHVVVGDATFTSGGGFTALPRFYAPTDGSINSHYRIVGSTGSYSATGTLNYNSVWASALASYKMDTTAPTVTVGDPVDGKFTNDTTPTLSGTSGSLNGDSTTVTVRVYPGGSDTVLQTLTATRAANGAWTVDAAALPDGQYGVDAEQTDAAGNVGKSSRVQFNIDSDAPDPPVVTGPSPDPGSNTNVSWSWTGEPASTYKCELTKGSTVIRAFGACTSPLSVALANGDGDYTFLVREFDSANNQSQNVTDVYTLDRVGPNPPIVTGPAPDPGNDVSPEWTFSGDEPGGSFRCRLSKGLDVLSGYAACTSPVSFNLTAGDGTYVVDVQQLDAAGNPSTPMGADYTLDAAPPETTIDTGPNGVTGSTDATFTFSSEPDATFECSFDGAAFSVCTSPISYNSLAEGDYTFEVRATDSVGNLDPTPDLRSFTVDTSAPSLSIDGGPADPSNDDSPTWDFSAESGATLECRLERDGTEVEAFAPCGPSSKSYDVGGEVDGTFTFEVRATDAAGNPSTASDAYTLDRDEPSSTATSPAWSQGTIVVDHDAADPTSAIEETELWMRAPGEAAFSLVDTVPAGVTSFVVNTTQGDGVYDFFTLARDVAGNYEDVPGSADTSTEVDSSAPSVTFDSTPPTPDNEVLPTWSFSSDPAASLECRLLNGSDEVAASAPCDSGTETYDLSAGADGTYTIEVTATDPAGNVGTGLSNYVFDRTDPSSAATSPATTAGPFDVTFSSSDDTAGVDEVELWEKGPGDAAFELVGTHAPTNTIFSITPSKGDGTYEYHTRARDIAGNYEAVPAAADTQTVFDSTAPTVTIDSEPNDADSDANPIWTFSTEPGATLECRLDLGATEIDPWTACDSGTVTYDLSAEVDGTYTMTVRGTDGVGNQLIVTDDYTLDRDDPSSDATSPSTAQAAFEVTYTYSDATAGVAEIELWGRGPNDADFVLVDTNPVPSSSFDVTTDQGDGAYRFFTRARDAAGNHEPAPASFDSETVVDTAAPAVTIDSSPTDPGADPSPVWTFSTEADALLECRLERGTTVLSPFTACDPGTATYELTDELDGTFTFTVRATDPAGNASTASDDHVLDRATPNSTADSPALSMGTFDVDFVATDATSGVDQVELWGRGPGDIAFSLWDTRGAAASSFPVTVTQGDGVYEFYTRAMDRAGNHEEPPATADSSTTVDSVGPTVQIDSSPLSPAGNPAPSWDFSGDADALLSCRLERGSTTVEAFTPCDSGTKLYDLTGEADGNYTFTLKGTDATGNETMVSDDYVLDRLDPTSTASSPAYSGDLISVTYDAYDGLSGIAEVELWAKGPNDPDAVLVDTAPPAGATFSYNATQGDGTYTFYTRATDGAGNREAPPAEADATTVVDTSAPDVTVDSGPQGTTFAGEHVTFTFSSSDPSATFECSFTADGTQRWEACGSPASFEAMDQGTYVFAVRATDAAGNVGGSASYQVPVTVPEEPSPSPSDTGSPSPSPSGSESPTPSDSPTPSITPSVTPSVTPSITPSITPSVTPSVSTSPKPTKSPTPSDDPSPTPSETPTPTPTPSETPAPTQEPPTDPTVSTGGGGVPTISDPDPKPAADPEPPSADGRPTLDEPESEPEGAVAEVLSQAEKLGRAAVLTVKKLAFPLFLAILVLLFILVQHWLDRKAPKLAWAPVESKYDLVGFE